MEGTIAIRNSRWIPACGAPVQPYLLNASNDGQHDFGYPCFMPREITIDGLVIDDRQHPKDYAGPYLFTDPTADVVHGCPPISLPADRAGDPPQPDHDQQPKTRVSPDSTFAASVRVIELN